MNKLDKSERRDTADSLKTAAKQTDCEQGRLREANL
jgi:hypothetical protein